MTLLEYSETIVEPNLFDSPNDDQRTREKKKTTRNKVLGPDTIGAITEEYSTLDICDSKGLTLGQWYAMSLEERGKLMAFSILKNKIEIVREWKRQMKEARKRAVEKTG